MDGCNHYRFRIPFEEMRKKVDGGVFDWAPMMEVREWSISKASFKPTDYDIMLLPRHRPLRYSEAELQALPESLTMGAKALGVPIKGESHLIDLVKILKLKQSIVLEYDDDYFTQARYLMYDDHDLLYELLGDVDAITVSTDYLFKLVKRHAPTTPVYVLENCVNWEEWQGYEHMGLTDKDHVVIGLTGSATHKEDWKVLEDVIPAILKKYGNVSFYGAGYLPEYFEELVDKEERALFLGTVSYEEYPSIVRQSDITLCPVVPDDEFNLGKSAIKAIEGLAASRPLSNGKFGGSVPITSKLYYYERVTGNGKRGLSVEHTPEAWYDAISEMVTNDKLRMRLAQRGRAWVYQNRSIERNWQKWWDAYTQIHRRKR